MRLFYLTLLLCLAVAALAVGRAPLLLAAGPGGGPGGTPPAWNGQDNATRPGGPHPSDGRQSGPGHGPAWAGQDNATRPGGPHQGGPGGPPPGMGGGPGGQAGQGGQGGHGAPPNRDALVAACAGKSAGDDCSFAGPRGGQVNGQCVQSRQGNELVCHPQRQ
jgi:hypothetical protein